MKDRADCGSKAQNALRWASLLIVMLLLVGCAGPSMRHVQAIDSSETTVKFLYNQYVIDGYERGMIECDIVEDDLVNCRELRVDYR